MICASVIFKLKSLRISYAALALELKSYIAADFILIIIKVYFVADRDNLIIINPFDRTAISALVKLKLYSVLPLVNFNFFDKRNLAGAYKIVAYFCSCIFAASKKRSVLHSGFYVFKIILRHNHHLEASADIRDIFGIIVCKSPDVSARRNNYLKQLIPKCAVCPCYVIGIVYYLHTETAVVLIKYICKIRYKHLMV